MANLHESYLAGHGFDITTPGLKTDYRFVALPTAPPGPVNMHACMYICVRAQVCACLNVLRRMDGRTDDGDMDGFKCVHVRVCVCARPCLCASDPVCEDEMTDSRSDGKIDGQMDGSMDC